MTDVAKLADQISTAAEADAEKIIEISKKAADDIRNILLTYGEVKLPVLNKGKTLLDILDSQHQDGAMLPAPVMSVAPMP